MKKGRITILCISVIFLTGCGSGNKLKQTISFAKFSINIPETFVSVAPGLVENKQIINKVLKSYKLDNPEGYDKNIVITQSTINPTLNYQQFATVNEQKLLKQLVGYTPGAKEVMTISCSTDPITEEDTTLQGILTSFTITDTFYEGVSTYYVHQFQFIAQEKGYIISYATDNDNEQKLFKTIIKSLQCN